MAQAGTVFTPGTSNISLNQFGSNSAYTQATQYRYPRVSGNISVGSHYYGKTFYALQTAGINNRSVLGTCSIVVDWGASVTWSLSANFTSTNQATGGTPVAADGYRVYMDSATSPGCRIYINASLYAATFNGWFSSPSFAGGALQSTANPYTWSGNTGVSQLYCGWS
jgi:hypothetical protein